VIRELRHPRKTLRWARDARAQVRAHRIQACARVPLLNGPLIMNEPQEKWSDGEG